MALFLMAGSPTVTAKPRYLELRAFATGRKNRQAFCELSPEAMLRAVEQAQGWSEDGYDVFFGVHPRRKPRGTADSVATLVGVFVDIDCGPGKPYPTSENATDRLAHLVSNGEVPPPSAVVASGTGVHVYWLLKEPVAMKNAEEYDAVMHGLANLLDGDHAVCDVGRVMRLPGTTNYKDPDTRRECSIEEWNLQRRYPLSEFPRRSPESRAASTIELPKNLERKLKRFVAALQESGVRLQVKRDKRIVKAVVFTDECPVCRGGPEKYQTPRRGTAHISPHSLRLKCKRDTCPAADHSGGLLPEQWIPAHYASVWCKTKRLFGQLPSRPGQAVPLSDIPRKLDEVCSAAFDVARAGEVLPVIDFGPGTGKTRTMLKRLAADALAGEAGVLAVPTNALAEEKGEELKALCPQTKVVLARSMTTACVRFSHLSKWQRYCRNLPGNVCMARGGCMHLKTCPAWTWRSEYKADRQHTVVIVTHSSLGHLLKQKALKPAYIVIDEYPAAIERRQSWQQKHLAGIVTPRNGGHVDWIDDRMEAARILHETLMDVETEREKDLKQKALPRYGSFLTGAKLRRRIEKAARRLQLDRAKTLAYGRDAPLPPFPDRLDMLSPPSDNYPVLDFDDLVVNLDKVGLHVPGYVEHRPTAFHRISISAPNLKGIPTIFLDATGYLTQDTLERLLNKPVKLFSTKVRESHSRHIWCKTTSYDAGRVAKGLPDLGRVRKALTRDLDVLFAEHTAGAAYGFIVNKPLEQALRDELSRRGYSLATAEKWDALRKKGNPAHNKTVVVDHYGNVRGTNAFEKVDVLALVGKPTPHIAFARFEAKQLGVDAATYARSREQAELLQAIARGRGVRRAAQNPLEVWCMMSAAPPVTPDRTVDARSGPQVGQAQLDAREAVREIVREFGFVGSALFDPKTSLGQAFSRFPPIWNTNNSLICQMRGNPEAMRARAFFKRMETAVAFVARVDGLRRIQATNPDRTGTAAIYEPHGRTGAYERWLGSLHVVVPIAPTVGIEAARRLSGFDLPLQFSITADLEEMYEERAAIREFEGGFPRPEAERIAVQDVLRHAGGLP